jgi:hypothetical protein
MHTSRSPCCSAAAGTDLHAPIGAARGPRACGTSPPSTDTTGLQPAQSQGPQQAEIKCAHRRTIHSTNSPKVRHPVNALRSQSVWKNRPGDESTLRLQLLQNTAWEWAAATWPKLQVDSNKTDADRPINKKACAKKAHQSQYSLTRALSDLPGASGQPSLPPSQHSQMYIMHRTPRKRARLRSMQHTCSTSIQAAVSGAGHSLLLLPTIASDLAGQ